MATSKPRRPRRPRPLPQRNARVMVELADLIRALVHANRIARRLRGRLLELPEQDERLHHSSNATPRQLAELAWGAGWQGQNAANLIYSAAPIPVFALLGEYEPDPLGPADAEEGAAELRAVSMVELGLDNLHRD